MKPDQGFKVNDKIDPRFMLERIAAMQRGPDRWFVQLGAHLGPVEAEHTSNDPTQEILIDSQWSGLFVEPVPTLFVELDKGLRASGRPLRGSNVAICPRSGSGNLTFYAIASHIDARTGMSSAQDLKRKSFPAWITQVGSLEKKNVFAYKGWFEKKGYNISDFIEEIPVRCLSVEELLREQRIAAGAVKALIIDCQGMDGAILRGIDFAAIGLRPAFIFYEHSEMKTGERIQTLEHLWGHGYTCWRWEGGNTWCLPVGTL